MISPPSRDQVIALAGIFQACALVDTLARTGVVRGEALELAMTGLLNQNPDSCEAVFGSIANLTEGIDLLDTMLSTPRRGGISDTLRYALGIMHLQRKILKSPAVMEKISVGIKGAAEQARHFSASHDNVIGNLADLYTRTISTFRFRIQVNGLGGYLQQDSIAKRVRCLLFAGIRAGFLWQQTGGRRWHFIVYRKQILSHIAQLRKDSRSSHANSDNT